MEPCRYDMGCWRPLCPYRHSGRRAARWAALWSLLAEQEAQIVDVPVPQIVEDAVTIIPKEHISERNFVEDVPVPQIQEQILEVANVIPPERISERIIEQVHDVPVPQIQEQILEVANVIPPERISERIIEQVHDQCLRSRNKFWKSRRSLRRGASRSVSSNALVDVPVPQIREQIVGVVKNIPHQRISERTAEQTCIPADTVHRQGCCRAYCDTAIGPSVSDCAKDGGSSAGAVIGNSADVPLISQINQVTKHAEISKIYYI